MYVELRPAAFGIDNAGKSDEAQCLSQGLGPIKRVGVRVDYGDGGGAAKGPARTTSGRWSFIFGRRLISDGGQRLLHTPSRICGAWSAECVSVGSEAV